MKKLLLLLFIVPLLAACGSDNNDPEPEQDYTSFIFEQTINNLLPNCVAAYKKDDNYYKIAELGDLKKQNEQTREVFIKGDSIYTIYLFTDLSGCVRIDADYNLRQNRKNVFKINQDVKGIEVTDKSDPTQYPQ